MDDGVEDEGQELANNNCHLVAGAQASSSLGGCHLCEVDRDRDRCSSNRKAQCNAPRHHDGEGWCQHARGGAQDEYPGEDEEHLSASNPIRERTCYRRSDCRCKQERGGYHAFSEGGEAQLGLHGLKCTVDNARVVSKEDPNVATTTTTSSRRRYLPSVRAGKPFVHLATLPTRPRNPAQHSN